MIRTSLTAMPRRGTVSAARRTALGTVAGAVAVIPPIVSCFVGRAALSGSGVSAWWFLSGTILRGVNMSPGPPGPERIAELRRGGAHIVISPGTVLTATSGRALFDDSRAR